MSRKREHKREQSRALAQQLGVHAAEVPEELLAHPRVCSPTVDVSLAVQRSSRGLLKSAGPFALHTLLVVIDSGGVRVARQHLFHAAVARLPGPAVLTGPGPVDDARVRYTRPGWFRLLCVLTAGTTPAQDETIRGVLAHVAVLRVSSAGAPARLLVDDVGTAVGAVPVELPAVTDAVKEGAVLTAATLATFAAAHRVDETLALRFVDAQAKLAADLTARVRL